MLALPGLPAAREGPLLAHTGGRNGRWGAVCFNLWPSATHDAAANAAAKVACRQMGFTGGTAARTQGIFPRPSGLPYVARLYKCVTLALMLLASATPCPC